MGARGVSRGRAKTGVDVFAREQSAKLWTDNRRKRADVTRSRLHPAMLSCHAGPMVSSYDMRPDDAGWTVFDAATGQVARVNGVAPTGLDLDDTADLVALMNRLARQDRKTHG